MLFRSGRDHTLFAKVDGYVAFRRKGKDDKIVHVTAEAPVRNVAAAEAVSGDNQ